MSKMIYTINDVSGSKGQACLDHYNKWLNDPKREFGTIYPGYPEDVKKPISRKKGKMMENVAVETNVAKPVKATKVKAESTAKAPRDGSKLSKALEVVKATGKDDKEACLVAIVNALSVTRGNASIYYAKSLAILG